jgi:hemerythrin-like domain-containing protein
MCEYCGCQQVDAIAELTAEHDRLRDLGRDLSVAANRGDPAAARTAASAMRALLEQHTYVEERGLFPLLAGEFGPQLQALVDEHHAIEAVLADLAAGTPEPGWRHATHLALAHLFDHILKEQDGVFPAALATLTPAEWDAVDAARRAARSPIAALR